VTKQAKIVRLDYNDNFLVFDKGNVVGQCEYCPRNDRFQNFKAFNKKVKSAYNKQRNKYLTIGDITRL